jgi:hypothetical protein
MDSFRGLDVIGLANNQIKSFTLNHLFMKTQVSQRPAVSGILKSIFILLILAACSEEAEVRPVLPESSNARNFSPDHPFYDLNVLLFASARSSELGFIQFRQNADEPKVIHLDTRVHGLEPNTNYLLQRAVDTVLDGNCTSSTWLTLGAGLSPLAIVTNDKGFGEAELFRSVAAIAAGTTFDIHFQIIKESTLEVVLTSDCYQYTVQ